MLTYNKQRIIVTILFLISFLFVMTNSSFASSNGHDDGVEEIESGAEKFVAGDLIFDHIMDSYDWHICTWKGKHISINLPIIVFSEGELYAFSSKHLHHGHQYATHDRHGDDVIFKIPDSGNYEGKVVRVCSDGTLTRPFDISMTKNVCALLISCALLVTIFLLVAKGYRQRGIKSPKGIQALIEPLVIYVRDEIARPNIGKDYEKYLPYLLTVFFFILFNNLLGLIPFFPFGANITGNIAVTAVLLVVSLLIISNTVKLAMYDRKDEIAIMKMVGATNGFIRLPFVVEGFVLGMLGAGIAFGLEWVLYDAVLAKVSTIDGLTGIFTMQPFKQLLLPMIVVFGGAGMFVGIVGSWTSIRKFMDV